MNFTGAKFFNLNAVSSTIVYAKKLLQHPYLINLPTPLQESEIDNNNFASSANYSHYNFIDNNNNIVLPDLIITANSQLQGVGKYGRTWVSPAGNLYCTMVLFKLGKYRLGEIGDLSIFNLLCTLSVQQVVSALTQSNIQHPLGGNNTLNVHTLDKNNSTVCDNNKITCKWPNDIMVGDQKLSGMLLELIYPKKLQGNPVVLFSVGVNIKNAPKVSQNGYQTTSLAQLLPKTATLPTPAKLAELIYKRIVYNLGACTKNSILEDWVKVAYRLDEVMCLTVGKHKKQGVFKGIDSEGRLILQNKNGLEVIHLGEIYHLDGQGE